MTKNKRKQEEDTVEILAWLAVAFVMFCIMMSVCDISGIL